MEVMKKYLIITLAIVCGSVRAQSDEVLEPGTRIVGGTTAPEGAVPYQVSFRLPKYNNHHFCGGGIISDRWILSAAHCFVRYKAPEVIAVVGTNSLTKSGSKYKLDKIVSNKNYNSTSFSNDVALTMTKDAIKYTDKVKPISLPSTNTGGKESCLLAGWGFTDKNAARKTDVLQWLNVTTLTVSNCQRSNLNRFARTHPVTENQICGYNGEGKGFCPGDSGGLLVCGNEAVGIVSFNLHCARGYPDVYARVYKYLDFIHEVMDGKS